MGGLTATEAQAGVAQPDLERITQRSTREELDLVALEQAHLHETLYQYGAALHRDDATALPFIADGGDGCISMVANAATGLCRTIYACCRHENWQSARALHGRMAPLASALAKECPAALKAALQTLGLMRAGVRLPLVELDGAAAREVTHLVAAIAERDLAAAS